MEAQEASWRGSESDSVLFPWVEFLLRKYYYMPLDPAFRRVMVEEYFCMNQLPVLSY
jgi:hypothetical protein